MGVATAKTRGSREREAEIQDGGLLTRAPDGAQLTSTCFIESSPRASTRQRSKSAKVFANAIVKIRVHLRLVS